MTTQHAEIVEDLEDFVGFAGGQYDQIYEETKDLCEETEPSSSKISKHYGALAVIQAAITRTQETLEKIQAIVPEIWDSEKGQETSVSVLTTIFNHVRKDAGEKTFLDQTLGQAKLDLQDAGKEITLINDNGVKTGISHGLDALDGWANDLAGFDEVRKATPGSGQIYVM